MVSLLEFVLCAFGIHKLADETLIMDEEPVRRCVHCDLIFQDHRSEVDALRLEHLQRAEEALTRYEF